MPSGSLTPRDDMRHRALLLFAVAASGCATTVVVPRTRPVVDGTGRAPGAPPSRAVLVVGPETLGVSSLDAAFPPGQGAASSASGEEALVTALGRELFERGWATASEAQVGKAVSRHRTAVALRDLAGRGATPLELALAAADGASADTVVLVRRGRVGWAATPSAAIRGVVVCPLQAEVEVGVYGRAGQLAWEGVVRAASTDLHDLSFTVGFLGRSRALPPGLACVATADCTGCLGESAPAPTEDAVRKLARHAASIVAEAIPAPR